MKRLSLAFLLSSLICASSAVKTKSSAFRVVGKNEVSVENYRRALSSDRFISFATWNWIDQVSQQSLSPTYYYIYEYIRPAR